MSHESLSSVVVLNTRNFGTRLSFVNNLDATLSYMTNTQPGELGSKFWLQLVTFGAGPLIGLLTTLFPSITDFVSSWLLPSTQALK